MSFKQCLLDNSQKISTYKVESTLCTIDIVSSTNDLIHFNNLILAMTSIWHYQLHRFPPQRRNHIKVYHAWRKFTTSCSFSLIRSEATATLASLLASHSVTCGRRIRRKFSFLCCFVRRARMAKTRIPSNRTHLSTTHCSDCPKMIYPTMDSLTSNHKTRTQLDTLRRYS